MSWPTTAFPTPSARRALMQQGLVLLLLSAGAAAQPDQEPVQLLYRRPLLPAYRNYASYPYVAYRSRLRADARYNFLGDFLAEGVRVFRLEEHRPGQGLISKDLMYMSMFNRLVIARTTYGRFNAALTVGDEIRTVLSPLTMQRAGLNGLRWEVDFPNNRGTFLVSRGFSSVDYPGFLTYSTPIQMDAVTFDPDSSVITIPEENPVYTLGGHWQTQVGDVLTLGGTVINQRQLNAQSDDRDGFMRGGVPYTEMRPPRVLRLRFTDDSPGDGRAGAAVFAVRLELEATVAGVDTVLSSDPHSPYHHPDLAPLWRGGRQVKGHREASGTDEAVCTFQLPEGMTPRRARFHVLVANDYRIAAAQEHQYFMGEGFEDRATPYLTLARAPGNVDDFSNREERVIEYGLYTGQTMYGLDFAADLVGLDVRGEVSVNDQYRKFPVAGGYCAPLERRVAWNVTGSRRLPGVPALTVGAEVFSMPAGYGGGYDSRRGGVLLYSDAQVAEEGVGLLAEYPLVDDNDDRDRYADDNLNDFPDATAWEAGVYPGLDEDNDNIPDHDRNANGIPDSEEPFMLYFSDPQEFVFGLDMNNNDVIDVRENDNRPDYPYPRDREGVHVHILAEPVAGLDAAAGYYRMQAPSSGRRARSAYVRAGYSGAHPRWGNLRLDHETKRVRDDIPDPVYQYDPEHLVTPLEPPEPDLLTQRNSWVHTASVRAVCTRLTPLRVEGNVKLTHNEQLDRASTRIDESGYRRLLTWIGRVEYEWRLAGFRIQPQYKALWEQLDVASASRPLEHRFQSAPMVRADYTLNEQLMLQFGQQGIRLGPVDKALAFRSIDHVESFRSYSSTDTILMLTIKGSYLGTHVATSSGIHLQWRRYDDPDAGEGARYSRFFVDVVAGYDTL